MVHITLIGVVGRIGSMPPNFRAHFVPNKKCLLLDALLLELTGEALPLVAAALASFQHFPKLYKHAVRWPSVKFAKTLRVHVRTFKWGILGP